VCARTVVVWGVFTGGACNAVCMYTCIEIHAGSRDSGVCVVRGKDRVCVCECCVCCICICVGG